MEKTLAKLNSKIRFKNLEGMQSLNGKFGTIVGYTGKINSHQYEVYILLNHPSHTDKQCIIHVDAKNMDIVGEPDEGSKVFGLFEFKSRRESKDA